GKSKQEIIYHYNDSGAPTKVTILGDASISGMDYELATKMYNDAVVQKRLLDSLKINIPLLPVNSSELRDISYLLSTADTIKDSSYGASRFLLVDNIDKAYRFNASDLEGFITTSNIVEKYTISMRDDTIMKEQIVFDEGDLERTYYWTNSKEFNI